MNPRVAEANASEKQADVELYFLGAQIPDKPLTSWVTMDRFFICQCLCFFLLGIELKTVHASWGCRED